VVLEDIVSDNVCRVVGLVVAWEGAEGVLVNWCGGCRRFYTFEAVRRWVMGWKCGKNVI